MAIPTLQPNTSELKPAGTLNSLGLYANPPLPVTSQAAGMQGTDGRAYTRNVGANELSSNQMNDITNSNSPYMQNARRRGLEAAAKRGMLNSSIAAGASERSALEAAMPMALQQAGAYGQAQSENLGYLNQNLMQERDIQNRALMEARAADSARDAASNLSMAMSEENQQRYRMFQENLAYEGEQRGLDRAHDFGRAEQGYGHDLGRMGQEYGYDIGRLGYTQSWQSRENDRDMYRSMARDDNQYSNQRYNDTHRAILNHELTGRDQVRQSQIRMIFDDPSTRLEDVEGFGNWMNFQSDQSISDLLDMYFGGGNG